MSKSALLSVFVLFLGLSGAHSAFACGGPPPPPDQGITVFTTQQIYDLATLEPVTAPFPINAGVKGNWVQQLSGAPAGTITSFSGTTVGASYVVSGAKLPATWDIYFLTGECANQDTPFTRIDITTTAATVELRCKVYESFAFEATPQPLTSIQNGGSGSQITMTGSGINGNNGPPVMLVTTSAGYVYEEFQAVSWPPDWSSCTGPMLYPQSPDTYYVFVGNQRSDGTWYDGAIDWLGYSTLAVY